MTAPLPFQRARSAEAKDQRRQQLLAAAAACLLEAPYAAVTMAEIARRAGVAKGASYRYFASKEALFLELLLGDLEAWLSELEPRLAEAPGEPTALARTITRTLTARPRLLRLLSLLEPTLETSADAAEIARFKHRLLAALVPTAVRLEARLPSFGAGDGVRFLRRAYALILGLAQVSSPKPAKQAALAANPTLAPFESDFAADLEAVLAAWMRGWAGD